MDNPRSFLMLLYGLFWAQLLSTSSRYNGFPTAAIMNRSEPDKGKRLLRLGVSFGVLNFFPIAWLYVLWQWVVLDHNAAGFWGFAGAALAALSIFGWLRLYHAIVASSGSVNFFYTHEEKDQYEIQGPSKLERPHYSHWLPGLFYMIVFPLAGYIVGRL
jgi:hypothetical protein